MLDERTLVLNKFWTPINTASVRRALCLVVSGLAKVVCPKTYETHTLESWADLAVIKNEPCIRGVNFRIRVPEIIILPKYKHFPSREVIFSRKNIFKRDKLTCQYCGKKCRSEDLSIDHVIPRSRGGQATWKNCVLACVKCNGKKANRTPEEAGMRLLKVPVKPKWKPYMTFTIGTMKQSWEKFISDKYWNVELES